MSVYEMVTDTVIPREWDTYLGNKKKLVEAAHANGDVKYGTSLMLQLMVHRHDVFRGTLVGSWTIVTGDAAFKAFHL